MKGKYEDLVFFGLLSLIMPILIVAMLFLGILKNIDDYVIWIFVAIAVIIIGGMTVKKGS
jgi:hypothetical protein